ncbi:MAG TPA: M20/M25/M40 family metallo-hydrolase [Gemmatimonadaceae bacterium]
MSSTAPLRARRRRAAGAPALLLVLGACASAPASEIPVPQPASRAETPVPPANATSSAITEADLRARLFAYAADSMLGREAGTPGNVKATDYIAAELRRIGLEPAGDGGTFFQTVPLVARGPDPRSSLAAGGTALALWREWAPLPSIASLFPFDGSLEVTDAPVIYGGRVGAREPAVTAEQARGKIVVLAAPVGESGQPDWQFWTHGGLDRFPGAAAVAIATLDISPPGILGFLQSPQEAIASPATATPTPFGLLVTRAAAERLLGKPLDGLAPGAAGTTVTARVRFLESSSPFPARNVVAVLRGGDPAVAGQYVAIGGHSDHVGLAAEPVDHDSLRAYNRVMRPRGADSEDEAPPTAAQWAQIRQLRDSLRRAGPVRRDSVFNGADDDGSGVVGMLEIAQHLASLATKPRRSTLFVFHTAEEKGLYGAQWFTDHPTVPRDSIVAQVNIDMIGRGGASDLPEGGPGYVQLIGSRRLSTELGDLVEAVNERGGHGMRFDYQYDANGHPDQYYCRSDHYEYARFGIPVVFLSTGGHQDYHQLTDEPQYIDYAQLLRVTRFIEDVAVTIANQDHRLVVDGPTPDPQGSCVQ